ncbi:MAG: glycosyltransferase family 2 protein [Lactobacillales bacterium]|jgi:glycosyltransferase involved in cell wall biosynthesis|nr:glycosyltransferase family 2 protein [Lactobacillales bacterium]
MKKVKAILDKNVLMAIKGYRYYCTYGLRATLKKLKSGKASKITDKAYQRWIDQEELETLEKMKREIEQFTYTPVISIVMPVYNAPIQWLKKCIDAVLMQSYTKIELCIADDKSTDPEIKKVLDHYKKADARVKVVYRKINGHISEATNSALALASGEFVALLDNDDELPVNALFEVVKALNKNSKLDLIYSDEDKIDEKGVRSDPAFKPDFSPDLLLGTNYISHLGVYRRSIIEKIGGFRKGFEGSQDYDLVLRFVEKTDASRIHHIPKILYHWRMLKTSTAVNPKMKKYAFEAGLKAVQEALVRRGLKGGVTHGAGLGLYDVHYDILQEDLVSIIIPARNGYEDTKRAIDSILTKTTYQNYEIIMADNESSEKKVFALYAEYQKKLGKRFIKLSINIPFNYSKINNLAAKEAQGKYFLFLNNDVEVIAPDWLSTMVSFAQFERVGMVGAKLYYPTNNIQHAGVVLGLGGVAGHVHHMYDRSEFGYFGRLQINVNYYAVTAACAMVKKDDFKQLGGFDENLTVAYNDIDLGIRFKKLGKDNIWAHQAELYHYESQTRGLDDVSKEKLERLKKESQYMMKRYSKIIENDPYYNPNLSKKSGRFLVKS